MTDTDSCKTCEYFDSKDWDSETKNWCRYNDLPAINEGLCEHYEPMIEPCPFCGGQVELRDVIDGHDETFAIHCNSCHIHFTKFDWGAYDRKDVIGEWNRRVKEC